MWDYNTYRLRRECFWFVLALLVNLVFAGWAYGQTPAAVVRIETDWELVLGTPDAGTDSPQVVCLLSPTDSVGGYYVIFELNQQSQPVFCQGGLQLQLWNGDMLLAHSDEDSGYLLEHEGESITWTQAMQLHDGRLWFEVIHGNSTTWGDFGAAGVLRVSVPSSQQSLNGFNPELSLKNSGVSFGGNRVQSMTLKRIRYIAADGTRWETDVNQSVRQLQ